MFRMIATSITFFLFLSLFFFFPHLFGGEKSMAGVVSSVCCAPYGVLPSSSSPRLLSEKKMPRIQFPTWYLWWLPSSCGMLDSLYESSSSYLCIPVRAFSPRHWKILYSGRLVSDDVLYNPSAMVRHTVVVVVLPFVIFSFSFESIKKKEITRETIKIPGPTDCCHFQNKKKWKKIFQKQKKISLCAFMMSRWCRFQWPPRFLYCCCCCVMDERVDGKWEEAPDSSSFFSYCSFSLESNDGAPADMFLLLLYDAQTCFIQLTAANIKKKEKKKQLGGISLFAATVAHNIT